jgi:hypothetical protein
VPKYDTIEAAEIEIEALNKAIDLLKQDRQNLEKIIGEMQRVIAGGRQMGKQVIRQTYIEALQDAALHGTGFWKYEKEGD